MPLLHDRLKKGTHCSADLRSCRTQGQPHFDSSCREGTWPAPAFIRLSLRHAVHGKMYRSSNNGAQEAIPDGANSAVRELFPVLFTPPAVPTVQDGEGQGRPERWPRGVFRVVFSVATGLGRPFCKPGCRIPTRAHIRGPTGPNGTRCDRAPPDQRRPGEHSTWSDTQSPSRRSSSASWSASTTGSGSGRTPRTPAAPVQFRQSWRLVFRPRRGTIPSGRMSRDRLWRSAVRHRSRSGVLIAEPRYGPTRCCVHECTPQWSPMRERSVAGDLPAYLDRTHREPWRVLLEYDARAA
jgi:hypothetical protein